MEAKPVLVALHSSQSLIADLPEKTVQITVQTILFFCFLHLSTVFFL